MPSFSLQRQICRAARDLKNRITLSEHLDHPQGTDALASGGAAGGGSGVKSNVGSPIYLSEEERRKKQLYGGEKGAPLGDLASPQPFKNAAIFELDGQAKLWIGKDYINFIVKDFTNLDSPYAGKFRAIVQGCVVLY